VGVITPPPSSNPFALQPDSLRLLDNLLRKLSPRHVVEFGSGASTVQFARWGSQNGATLLSIEHDRGWVEEIRARLSAAERSTVKMSHSPLRLTRRGPRLFLTYGCLPELDETLGRAGLILIDGPHVSGRELVLHTVLASCSAGSVIVVDDYCHYAIREMLGGVGSRTAACFVGEAIEENSHGLFVLRCERRPEAIPFPTGAPADVLRSYWRCLRDYRSYGTGA
jgi:Methyltransferase domain